VPALPPPRRAIAPLRRDGGWRFESGGERAEVQTLREMAVKSAQDAAVLVLVY
jgi:hypothetical protein